MMDFKRIEELVKEHYETGRYSDCFFIMHPASVYALKEHLIPNSPLGNLIDPRAELFGPPTLTNTLGIPVVIVTSLAIGEWELVDREGNIMEHARLDEELETSGDQTE